MSLSPHEFSACVVADAMYESEGAYWLRRAAALEWARPRPGDFTGRATAEEIRERDRRLAEQAAACRARAELHRGPRRPLGVAA